MKFTPTKRRLSTSHLPIFEPVLKPTLPSNTIYSISLPPSHPSHLLASTERFCETRISSLIIYLPFYLGESYVCTFCLRPLFLHFNSSSHSLGWCSLVSQPINCREGIKALAAVPSRLHDANYKILSVNPFSPWRYSIVNCDGVIQFHVIDRNLNMNLFIRVEAIRQVESVHFEIRWRSTRGTDPFWLSSHVRLHYMSRIYRMLFIVISCFPMLPLYSHWFLCFLMYPPVFLSFCHIFPSGLFSPLFLFPHVSPCVSMFSYEFLFSPVCFAMYPPFFMFSYFPLVFLRFLLFSYRFLCFPCFPMFSPVFLCFAMYPPVFFVFLCASLFSYVLHCFSLFFNVPPAFLYFPMHPPVFLCFIPLFSYVHVSQCFPPVFLCFTLFSYVSPVFLCFLMLSLDFLSSPFFPMFTHVSFVFISVTFR